MIEILSYGGGEIWSVPVTTRRANVLWYNKAIFEVNNLQPPATVSDFFQRRRHAGRRWYNTAGLV